MSNGVAVDPKETLEMECDVAIIGAGLAGACFARQMKLKRATTKIVVLESSSYPQPIAAHKVGESTVEVGAHYLAEKLGLRSYFEEHQLRKFGLRYYFDSVDKLDISSRVELGSTNYFNVRSYQLDRGHLENHLKELIKQQGVTVLEGCKVKQIELSGSAADAKHILISKDKRSTVVLKADWIIDASGRTSVLKKKLNLERAVQHNVSSSWWRLDAKIDIDSFKRSKDLFGKLESDRWFSTNHLMGHGYWVWIIPLRENRTSIGIVYDESIHDPKELKNFEVCLNWLTKYEPLCAEACRSHADKLLDFKVLRRFAYDCERVFSSDRWGLTGEAGLFLDPFYSPGSDFIAYSNTMLTDLVARSLDNEKIVARTEVYDQIYKALFNNSLLVYQSQYQVFGNPLVMPVKVVWDFVIYWMLLAPLIFHDLITDLELMSEFGPAIKQIERKNQEMQELFIKWNKAERPVLAGGKVDLASNSFLREINLELLQGTRPQNREQMKVFLKRIHDQLEIVANKIKGLSDIQTRSEGRATLSTPYHGLIHYLTR
jgi:flavin-dependent dehydrogenase